MVGSADRWWLVVAGGGWWWLMVVGSSGDRAVYEDKPEAIAYVQAFRESSTKFAKVCVYWARVKVWG